MCIFKRTKSALRVIFEADDLEDSSRMMENGGNWFMLLRSGVVDEAAEAKEEDEDAVFSEDGFAGISVLTATGFIRLLISSSLLYRNWRHWWQYDIWWEIDVVCQIGQVAKMTDQGHGAWPMSTLRVDHLATLKFPKFNIACLENHKIQIK